MTFFLHWLLNLWAGVFLIISSESIHMDIYLAIGQSNMAGRAPLVDSLMGPLSDVYLFKGDTSERWVPATNPMNIFSTVRKEADMQQLSPSFAFARDLAARGNKKLGMVVNARGGTSIKLWLPGTDYYASFIERLKDAARDGEVKGVIWHQGESDVQDLNHYLQDLQDIIIQIRKDIGNPELPFVAGQIIDNTPERRSFNQLILQLPELLPHTAVVSSEGMEVFDGVHFDQESQLMLGKRYAEKMLELQGK